MSDSHWIIDQIDAGWATLSPAPEVSASLKAEVEAQLSSLSADDDGGDFSI